jgi:hypothetical protein
MIDGLLSSRNFPPAYHVEGREAIANLFSSKKRCGIYVLHFADGRYYVGKTVDVNRRYVEHRRNHPDIVRLSFKLIEQAELATVELETMHYLKAQGLSLRNIQGIDPPPGLADFDLIMHPTAQDRWLRDVGAIDLSGSRLVDPELRSKYHGRYLRFAAKPYASDVIDVLREYVAIGIPRARASEESFWSCSCLPASQVYARVNINWQEVLTAWTVEDELYFSFHLALSPLNFGTQLSAYYRRFPNQNIVISLDEAGDFVIDGEWQDADMQEYGEEDHFGMPSELNGLLSDLFATFPTIAIQDHRYKPGGDDQVRVIVGGKADALALLQDEEIRRAIRVLNLRLMRLGPSPYRTSHCLDLADQLVDEG